MKRLVSKKLFTRRVLEKNEKQKDQNKFQSFFLSFC